MTLLVVSLPNKYNMKSHWYRSRVDTTRLFGLYARFMLQWPEMDEMNARVFFPYATLIYYRPHPKDGEGNSFTLLVCPRGEGGSGPAAGGGGSGPAAGGGVRSSCRGGGGGSGPAAGGGSGPAARGGSGPAAGGGSGPAAGGGGGSGPARGGQVQLLGGGVRSSCRGGVRSSCWGGSGPAAGGGSGPTAGGGQHLVPSCGRYASCVHAGGLSCSYITTDLVIILKNAKGDK